MLKLPKILIVGLFFGNLKAVPLHPPLHSELVYQVVSFYGRSCLIKCDKLLRDISENQVIIIFSLIGCELATMRDTNGEFVETLHSTLRLHEEHHGFKVVRKLG